MGQCTPQSQRKPGIDKRPTPFRVGGAGAPTSWIQLQPPSHGCGPGHPCTLGAQLAPPTPTGLEGPAIAAWPLLAPGTSSDFRAKSRPSPRYCRNLATYEHTWGSADMPALCRPSRLWAPMNTGRKPRGRLEGVRVTWYGPAGAPWHSLGTMDSRRRQTCSQAKRGRSLVKPHLHTRDGLRPGGQAASSTYQSGNLWCFFWPAHGRPWTNQHTLPSF